MISGVAGQRIRRIALGTAQFGLDYGITNEAGRVPEADVTAILSLATELGIDTLDTAFLYGDAEQVIGELAGESERFRIVTKTPKFSDCADSGEAVVRLRSSLGTSLERLGRSSLGALLVHDADDLLGPHGEDLWAAMAAFKAEGRVGQIGVSIYEGAQVDAALERFRPDVVQLPINPLDRRLIEGGQLARLADAGVEVHARSLFLQGLLLEDPSRIPTWLSPIRFAVEQLDARAGEHGLTRLEAVIAWALALRLDRLVVGVTRPSELQAIASAAKKSHCRTVVTEKFDFGPIASAFLNPARWEELSGAGAVRQKDAR